MELEGGRRDYVRKPEVEENARRAQASEQKPGRAERGQPSNVFCYKGSTYLLTYFTSATPLILPTLLSLFYEPALRAAC